MDLAVDIGNTNIKCGIFQDGNLIITVNITSDINLDYTKLESQLKNVLCNYNIKKCAIASVVDELTDNVYSAVNNLCNITPQIIRYDKISKLKSNVKNLSSIGIDRIINVYAAEKIYSFPAIVVDIGTASTFEIIDKKGNFAGGFIFPGVQTQLKSLYSNTSKLPDIKIDHMKTFSSVINSETNKAILSGVIRGQAHAIEGLIKDSEKELGYKTKIIGTGGGAEFISKYMTTRNFDIIDKNLTLKGIMMLS